LVSVQANRGVPLRTSSRWHLTEPRRKDVPAGKPLDTSPQWQRRAFPKKGAPIDFVGVIDGFP